MCIGLVMLSGFLRIVGILICRKGRIMSINVAFFCTGNGSFLKFIEQNRDMLGRFAWGGGGKSIPSMR